MTKLVFTLQIGVHSFLIEPLIIYKQINNRTRIGFVAAFPILNVHRWRLIFLTQAKFLPISKSCFSLCSMYMYSYTVDSLPMEVDWGEGGTSKMYILFHLQYQALFRINKGAMNFHLRHSNGFPNCQLKTRRRSKNCKGLSEDGGRTEFSENLRASLFNDDLSNEPKLQPDPSRWTVPLSSRKPY